MEELRPTLDMNKGRDIWISVVLNPESLTDSDLARLRKVQIECRKQLMAKYAAAKRALENAFQEFDPDRQGDHKPREDKGDEGTGDEPPAIDDQKQLVTDRIADPGVVGVRSSGPKNGGHWDVDLNTMGRAIKDTFRPLLRLGVGGGGSGKVGPARPPKNINRRGLVCIDG